MAETQKAIYVLLILAMIYPVVLFIVFRGPKALKAFKRLLRMLLDRRGYMACLDDIERIMKDLCLILDLSYEDMLAFLRVLRRSSSYSHVSFRAAGLEVEIQYSNYEGLKMTVKKSEHGVKMIKEYDLDYLKLRKKEA